MRATTNSSQTAPSERQNTRNVEKLGVSPNGSPRRPGDRRAGAGGRAKRQQGQQWATIQRTSEDGSSGCHPDPAGNRFFLHLLEYFPDPETCFKKQSISESEMGGFDPPGRPPKGLIGQVALCCTACVRPARRESRRAWPDLVGHMSLFCAGIVARPQTHSQFLGKCGNEQIAHTGRQTRDKRWRSSTCGSFSQLSLQCLPCLNEPARSSSSSAFWPSSNCPRTSSREEYESWMSMRANGPMNATPACRVQVQ